MKRRLSPRQFAMMAACALVANAANFASAVPARAEGVARTKSMPEAAKQLVQTMRPMYTKPSTPARAALDGNAYGGAAPGASAASGGHRESSCSGQARHEAQCDLFFAD